MVLCDCIQHPGRRISPGNALLISLENRKARIPARREVAALHLLDLAREFRIFAPVPLEPREPSLAKLMASSPGAGVEMLAHALRHQELCVFGPAVAALGKSNLLLAERLPVGCTGVLLVRSSVPDMTLQDDERRLVFDVPETLDAIGEAPS